MNSSNNYSAWKEFKNVLLGIGLPCFIGIMAGTIGKKIAPLIFPELAWSRPWMLATAVGIAVILWLLFFTCFLVILSRYKRAVWNQIMSQIDPLLA